MYTVPAKLMRLLENVINSSRESFERADKIYQHLNTLLNDGDPKLLELQIDYNKWYLVHNYLLQLRYGKLSEEDKVWLEKESIHYTENIQQIISQICEVTYGIKKSLRSKLQACIEDFEQSILETEFYIYELEFETLKMPSQTEVAPCHLEANKALALEKNQLCLFQKLRALLNDAKARTLSYDNLCWLHEVKELLPENFVTFRFVVDSLKPKVTIEEKESRNIQYTLRYQLQRQIFEKNLADTPGGQCLQQEQDVRLRVSKIRT